MPTLDPTIARILKERGPQPDLTGFTHQQVRAGFEVFAKTLPRGDAKIGRIEDLDIPDGAGGIQKARLYRPDGESKGTVLFFHGGGYVVGGLESHDPQARRVCALASANVLAVDYRLAPEHAHPAAVDDAWAALQWCRGDGRERGIDPKLVVMGDSAGGGLAAGLTLRNKRLGGAPLLGQVLVYPMVDHYSSAWPSYKEMSESFGLTDATMRWFWDHYVPQGGKGGPVPEESAPVRAKDHSGLPPALILTAECDVLRDEGEDYARRLREAGVPVELQRCAGMNHGFIALVGVVAGADQAVRKIGSWVASRF